MAHTEDPRDSAKEIDRETKDLDRQRVAKDQLTPEEVMEEIDAAQRFLTEHRLQYGLYLFVPFGARILVLLLLSSLVPLPRDLAAGAFVFAALYLLLERHRLDKWLRSSRLAR